MPRLFFTTSFNRLAVMPSARAAAACERPRSSRKCPTVSPGDVGGRCVGSPQVFSSFLVVVVPTPYLLGRAALPAERDAVLVVDADAVTVREPLKPVARWLCHVADDVCPL